MHRQRLQQRILRLRRILRLQQQRILRIQRLQKRMQRPRQRRLRLRWAHRQRLQRRIAAATTYSRLLVPQGHWPFAAHTAAIIMRTSTASSEALLDFAAGIATRSVTAGSRTSGMGSGAKGTNRQGSTSKHHHCITRHNNCGTVLLGPFLSPYRSIALPIYLATCFAASFSSLCQFIWPLALQPIFQLHGQFVWSLALQALFFVCFHVNQNQ
jgi:hypothetical protein